MRKFNTISVDQNLRFNFNFIIYCTVPRHLDPVRVSSFSLFGITIKEACRIAKVISSTDGYFCVVDKLV